MPPEPCLVLGSCDAPAAAAHSGESWDVSGFAIHLCLLQQKRKAGEVARFVEQVHAHTCVLEVSELPVPHSLDRGQRV